MFVCVCASIKIINEYHATVSLSPLARTLALFAFLFLLLLYSFSHFVVLHLYIRIQYKCSVLILVHFDCCYVVVCFLYPFSVVHGLLYCTRRCVCVQVTHGIPLQMLCGIGFLVRAYVMCVCVTVWMSEWMNVSHSTHQVLMVYVPILITHIHQTHITYHFLPLFGCLLWMKSLCVCTLRHISCT